MEETILYNVQAACQRGATVGLRVRHGAGLWHEVAVFEAANTRKQFEVEMACEALGRVDARFEAQIVGHVFGQGLPLKRYSPHTGWRFCT
jgi:hypothetical protein